jgi:hypothetical protein
MYFENIRYLLLATDGSFFGKPTAERSNITGLSPDHCRKSKRRNSFYLILLGVLAPWRGPTKAPLYQGHGAWPFDDPP